MFEKKWSLEEKEKFRASAIFKEIKNDQDIRDFNFRMMLVLPEKIKNISPDKKGHLKDDRFVDYLKIGKNMEYFTIFPAIYYVFLRNIAIIHHNQRAFEFFHHGLLRWYRKIDLSHAMIFEIYRRILKSPHKDLNIEKNQPKLDKKLEKDMRNLGFIVDF